MYLGVQLCVCMWDLCAKVCLCMGWILPVCMCELGVGMSSDLCLYVSKCMQAAREAFGWCISVCELDVHICGYTLCVHIYISVCVTQGCVCSPAPRGRPLLPGPA